jgi:hypothetical protein
MVDRVRATAGPSATAAILVVTDDRDLRGQLGALGARTARTHWLIARLERSQATGASLGRSTTHPSPRSSRPSSRAAGPRPAGSRPAGPRPSPTPATPADPTGDPAAPPDVADDDEPRWSPGRGATTKRGNPRRAPKQKRP